MRLIDADALFKKVKTECNPYGKPTIGFEDGIRVINWIEQAPTVGGWISVKDRLPGELKDLSLRKTQKPVLLYAEKDGAIYVGWYCGRDYRGIDCFISRTSMNAYQHITKKITYWMPMPEPPPKEGDVECA